MAPRRTSREATHFPRRDSLFEEVSVDLDVLAPLGGHIVLREDRLHGAFVDAETAIDAGVRVDVQLLLNPVLPLLLGRMDAVDGANLDAGGVLGSDAGFGDDVCHGGSVLSRNA
ncbi:MAG: hypothetical protein RL591_1555 [Planctomycetota bacterium]